MEETYYTQKRILESGWTKGMINKLLGEADRLKPNPHGRRAAPIKLFLISRVETAEQTADFAEALEKANKRRQAMSPAIAKKRSVTIQNARECPITVIKKNSDKVMAEAIEAYNLYHCGSKFAHKDDDKSFIRRITVNYIRHHLTEYDFEICNVYGKVGVDKAKEIIRARVYTAIGIQYPDLKKECTRQARERFVDMSLLC